MQRISSGIPFFSANITNRFQYLCNFIKHSNRNKFLSAQNCISIRYTYSYTSIYIFGPLLKLCPKFIVMRRFYLDLFKTNIFCCQSLLLLLLLSRQQNEIHRERKGRVGMCVARHKCKYRTEQQWQVKPTQDGHKHLHRCSEIPILHIFFLSLSLSDSTMRPLKFAWKFVFVQFAAISLSVIYQLRGAVD